MTGKTFDSTRMAEAIGYGNMTMGDAESRRKQAAIQTAQAAGADTNNEAVQNVIQDLTKDYRGVMKALDKKDGKNIMSIIEKDLNPDVFIGVSLPLEYGKQGFFNKTKTFLEQTKSNVKNLLLTIRGERLGNPTFGSDLMRTSF